MNIFSIIAILSIFLLSITSVYSNEELIKELTFSPKDIEVTKKAVKKFHKENPLVREKREILDDESITNVFNELKINELSPPKFYLTNFPKEYSYVVGLFDGEAIYLSEEKWKSITDLEKKAVIMHELGHWAGLKHTENKEKCNFGEHKSLMCPSRPLLSELTEKDIIDSFKQDLGLALSVRQ